MGAIESKYNQLDRILLDYEKGLISSKQLRDKVSVISVQERFISDYIAAQILGFRENGKIKTKLIKANLIENKDLFSKGVIQGNHVVCPMKEDVITREDCLDISGHPPEGFDCSGCEHFATTRQMIIDNT